MPKRNRAASAQMTKQAQKGCLTTTGEHEHSRAVCAQMDCISAVQAQKCTRTPGLLEHNTTAQAQQGSIDYNGIHTHSEAA
eukprot:1154969-Pelagomonas_calceolata.AAC.4